MPRGKKSIGVPSRVAAESLAEHLNSQPECPMDTLKHMLSLKETFDDFNSRSQAGGPTVAQNRIGFTMLQSQGALKMRMRLARKLAEKAKATRGPSESACPVGGTGKKLSS
jgi:hypothetical protein